MPDEKKSREIWKKTYKYKKSSNKFENFLKSQSFVNKVGEIAEKEGHHPAILLEWGKVQVSWWTHKIRGLHENDFIMSAKTDQLFDSM